MFRKALALFSVALLCCCLAAGCGSSAAPTKAAQPKVEEKLSPEQRLEKEAQALLAAAQKRNKSKLPLYVAVDEEGGLVSRMEDKLTPPPSAQKIGATGDPEVAQKYAESISRPLKDMGFNVNFAPVADLGSPYERSYSEDAAIVTKFVKAAVQGYAKENMLCSLKHFPGIGKGTVDSHVDGSNINLTLAELMEENLLPFAQIIKELPNKDFMVMVSHLSYPKIDAKYPASISPKIITDVLRKELGFKGLIITDDLEMGAVAKHYKFGEMGVLAVKAGVDILLVCHENEHIVDMYKGVYAAYKKGEITEARIDASVKAIIRNKLQRGLRVKG